MNETLVVYNSNHILNTNCSLVSFTSQQDFYDSINRTFGSNVIENNILNSTFNIVNDATYGNGMSIVYGDPGTSNAPTYNEINFKRYCDNGYYHDRIAGASNIFAIKNVAKPSKIILKCRYSGYGGSQIYLMAWGLKFIGEQTGTIFIPFSMEDDVGNVGYWRTQGVAHLYNNITQYTDWSNNAVNGFMRYDDTFIIDNMDKMFTTNDESFIMAYSCPNIYNNNYLYIEQLDIEF